MECDRGMEPYRPQNDGYFMYDPRPMSDQRSDKNAIPGSICCFSFRLKLETGILNCQFVSAVLSRTTNTLSTRIATDSTLY